MGNYITKPLMERFMHHVSMPHGRDGCWIWTGCIQKSDKNGRSGGYGKMGAGGGGGRTLLAHRVAYELFVGPIPNDKVLDHVCHKASECLGGVTCPHRRCVNPTHLEPVTHIENTRRGNFTTQSRAVIARQRGKTHCPHGHEYSKENTYIDAKISRHCRTCGHNNYLRYKAARRSAA